LFAVPGSVLSGTSLGTNGLISDSKALPLNNLKKFASGDDVELKGQHESSIAKRASDAIRELGSARQFEISKCAGLTNLEAELAMLDLKRLGVVVEHNGAYSLR
jgi:predicted Rossmann fold nucleotide-binding protein DprA/Smf involved in DNA uptake